MGGLVSSALLAKEGKNVLLLEQHRIPGGYCTSYKRKGFIFNVPSVMSNIAEGESYSMLRSLGLFDEVEWIEIENFAKYIYPECEIVMPANNLEGCQENLMIAFPSEKKAIEKVFSEIRTLQKNVFSSREGTRSIKEIVSLITVVPKLISLSKKSYYEYLRKFTENEKLITVLSSLWGFAGLPSKRVQAISMLMMSGECYGKPTYFPRDGYQAISDFFAEKFLGFGGKVKYNTKAKSILMKDKKAIGVELANGEKIFAEAISSNADTKKTFFELVGRQNLPYRLASKIDAHTPSASGLSLHVGTDLDLSQLDLKYGCIMCGESWKDENSFYDRALANNIDLGKDDIVFGVQATSLLSDRLAPKGKHSLHVLVFPFSRGYKENFGIVDGKRGKAYRGIKNALCDILIEKVERIIPGLSGSVVVKELATPYTFERFVGATNGGWYDGVFSIKQKFQKHSSKTPIRNLYLTGTKAFGGGGMPPALRGGIETFKTILGK